MDLMWDWKERVESRMTPRFADFGRCSDGTAVNKEEEISNLQEQRLGGHNHELYFFAVKFE